MRYLTRYEEIMTNKRAVLLLSANVLIGLVSSIVFLGPFSLNFKDTFTFGSAVFHTFGVKGICLLYIFAYRSLKRTVDNLHIESNIGHETKPVENANTVETNPAVNNTGKNDRMGNYPCAPKCSDVAGSSNIQSGSKIKYQPDCKDAGTSNIHQGKHPSGNTSSNGPDNGSCADTANNVPLNDLCTRRSNSVPGMDPCGKALTIAENNLDMLVVDLTNGPSMDACGTARIDVASELEIRIKDEIIDNNAKESDKSLPQELLNEPKSQIPSKDPKIQNTKPLENRFGTTKSPESRSVEKHHYTMRNKQGLEIVSEPHNNVKNSRGADNKATPNSNRRRPDHEFAKAVLLINVAMLLCYLPGVIVHFTLYPDIWGMTHLYAQTWCFLLNYLYSTLNAVIFIACSSEQRLYVKSFFSRMIESS
eukprot:Seg935.7 transcript_id=Seg935.7/GoldUCD/mRNA.D3Y31 product="hypothetical protein" protein_id=Seg935.7/GoldUCD/D3Y31